MSILLAFISGIASFFNYIYYNKVADPILLQLLQGLLAGLAILSCVMYRGKRTRPSYKGSYMRVFTIGFSICVLALMGSISILVVMILGLKG